MILYKENIARTGAIKYEEGVIEIFLAPFGSNSIELLLTVNAAEEFARLLLEAVKEAHGENSNQT